MGQPFYCDVNPTYIESANALSDIEEAVILSIIM